MQESILGFFFSLWTAFKAQMARKIRQKHEKADSIELALLTTRSASGERGFMLKILGYKAK
jgi:hypothetical protein